MTFVLLWSMSAHELAVDHCCMPFILYLAASGRQLHAANLRKGQPHLHHPSRYWLGVLKFMATGVSFAGPLLLHAVLQYLESTNAQWWPGVYLQPARRDSTPATTHPRIAQLLCVTGVGWSFAMVAAATVNALLRYSTKVS